MADKIEKISEAYNILKEYNGTNSYIIDLKNGVFAYKTISLNDFHVEFIIRNHNKEPKYIGKTVKISEWLGKKLQEQYNLEFTPEKLLIGWYLGDTDTHYVFYCRYRQSQEKDALVFAGKDAIYTDFLSDDYNSMDIDFTPYENKGGIKVMEHQKQAVKFLINRKKCILADEMGGGKTMSAILGAIVGGFTHILVVSPASVKKTWENELRRFVNEEDIVIVQGSKWKDAKFTIINYDILDNFYTIPTQKIKKK